MDWRLLPHLSEVGTLVPADESLLFSRLFNMYVGQNCVCARRYARKREAYTTSFQWNKHSEQTLKGEILSTVWSSGDGLVSGPDPHRLGGSPTLRSLPSGITLPSTLEKDVRSAITVCGIGRTGKHATFRFKCGNFRFILSHPRPAGGGRQR